MGTQGTTTAPQKPTGADGGARLGCDRRAKCTFGGIASYRPRRIEVDVGVGRVVVDDDGTLVHYGTSARTDRFEQTFIDILNARGR